MFVRGSLVATVILINSSAKYTIVSSVLNVRVHVYSKVQY